MVEILLMNAINWIIHITKLKKMPKFH